MPFTGAAEGDVKTSPVAFRLPALPGIAVTIASLTAATPPPAAAPKGAASAVPAPAPDVQTAAVSSESPPVASTIDMAISAAKQSAAARQDGLSVLMANLLRATAAGGLPAPVQQAVDQLLALHLPTDVAPDAATVKTALATSGLFTEANLAAAGSVPVDIKTALLQLNTAAESWLSRATSALDASPIPRPTPATVPLATPSAPVQTAPATFRAAQAVPLVAPQSTTRDPTPPRRTGARTNEPSGSKPLTPNAPSPQRPTSGKNQSPVDTSTPAGPADTAPDAETIRTTIRTLAQITQATKGSLELPKEIKAVLALVNKAAASSVAQPSAPAEAVKSAPPAETTAPRAPIITPPVARTDSERRAAAETAAAPTRVNQATTPATPGLVAPQKALVQTGAPPELAPQISDAYGPPAAPQAAPQSLAPQKLQSVATSAMEQLLALQSTPDENPIVAHASALVLESKPAALAAEVSQVQLPAPRNGTTDTTSQPAPQQPSASSPLADATPSSAPETGLPNDLKMLLSLLNKAADTWLPRAANPAGDMPSTSNTLPRLEPQNADTRPPSNAPPQSVPPSSPAEPEMAAVIATLSNAGLLPATMASSGGLPNNLKTLLLLFNAVAEMWLPHTTANAPAGTPSVPPPLRGAPSKAQPAALATLPEGADAAATAKLLLSGSDAALARQTLLQIASLPDAAPQSRTSDARWMFDVPLMTQQGAAVAQVIIERDGSGVTAEKPTPVWRVQFAINIEPLGPVRANLALCGDHTWVTISADRPESLDRLQSGVSWLADALQSTELNADIAFQLGRAPQGNNAASRFVDQPS